MMSISRKARESLIAKVIIRHRNLDPLSLAEKIAGLLESQEELAGLMEDAVAEVPAARDDESINLGVLRGKGFEVIERDEEEHAAVSAPPPPARRTILMPDDPEYKKALADTGLSESERRQRKVNSVRVSNIAQTAPTGKTVQYWSFESLLPIVHERTPEKIWFVPEGLDESQKTVAVRNVEAMVGLDQVKLSYAHPDMAQDGASQSVPGAVNISLVAFKILPFSQEQFDFDEILEDILRQLKALYKPKRKHLEPVGEDPGPLGFNINDPALRPPMGGAESIRGTSGWSMVEDPQRSVLQEVVRSNQSGGNRR